MQEEEAEEGKDQRQTDDSTAVEIIPSSSSSSPRPYTKLAATSEVSLFFFLVRSTVGTPHSSCIWPSISPNRFCMLQSITSRTILTPRNLLAFFNSRRFKEWPTAVAVAVGDRV
jgi:hypothetical protein